ncbi:hypothetical protein BH09BAC2_BH09BAC2_02610 [soil metagenome]
MDGLVSTGNKFPYTILKIIFTNMKKYSTFFINILFFHVDNCKRILLLKQCFMNFLRKIIYNYFSCVPVKCSIHHSFNKKYKLVESVFLI